MGHIDDPFVFYIDHFSPSALPEPCPTKRDNVYEFLLT